MVGHLCGCAAGRIGVSIKTMYPAASAHARALLAALAAAALMGSLCIFVRESHCSAQLCSFSRFGVGFVLIGVVACGAWICRGVSLRFSPAAFGSGICTGLCVLFYFLAIRYTAAGIAALLPAMGPLLAAVWESLLEKRLPPRRDVMLLMVASIGILLVTCFAGGGASGQNHVLGIVYGTLAALFYSFYIVLNRFMSAEISMLRRLFWQSAAGTLTLIGPLLATGAPLEGLTLGWPWLLGIGVLQGAGVLALVAYAMRRLTALEFGIISCLEPTEATFWGWLVYAEAVLPGQWVGFALVLAAIVAKSQRHIGWRISCFMARHLQRRT